MNISDLLPVIERTWPPSRTTQIGPFTVPSRDPGGSRVSAARLTDASAQGASVGDLDRAEAAMDTPLFMVPDHQTALDEALAARGYLSRDHTDAMVIRASEIAATPPPVTAFDIWPPLAIQTELWEAGGIDAARRAVMARADCTKTSLFGRIIQRPAGAAFVGIHQGIAMLHALEIAPVARRKGLAVHMMRLAAKWAQEHDADWLSILVTQENAAGQGLYASLGMQTVGTYHYREKQGGTAP